MDNSNGLSTMFRNLITSLKENSFCIIHSMLNSFFCLNKSPTENTPGDHSNHSWYSTVWAFVHTSNECSNNDNHGNKVWVTHTQGVSCPWPNPFSVVQPLASRSILIDTPHFQNHHKTSAKLVSSNFYLLMRYGCQKMERHHVIQGAAERTPRFGRVIASGGERIQWWGARRRTAVYVPFSVYTMVWLGEHRAFIVEEFIKNGGSLVAT